MPIPFERLFSMNGMPTYRDEYEYDNPDPYQLLPSFQRYPESQYPHRILPPPPNPNIIYRPPLVDSNFRYNGPPRESFSYCDRNKHTQLYPYPPMAFSGFEDDGLYPVEVSHTRPFERFNYPRQPPALELPPTEPEFSRALSWAHRTMQPLLVDKHNHYMGQGAESGKSLISCQGSRDCSAFNLNLIPLPLPNGCKFYLVHTLLHKKQQIILFERSYYNLHFD